MDIYSDLSLQVIPQRAAPDVWIKRLAIYEKLSPPTQPIRDTRLTRGVNIVWAEEADADDGDADITGHSAGKTSFCRLLRYLLGEKTFGTKANMAMIQRRFPSGYVGGELSVKGRRWAVIRPIGNGRNSYLKPDATIEEVIQDRRDSATQDDYPAKLGLEDLLIDMDAGAVLRTNRAIEWGHVLAWCTRDQEARFQNIYEWRSPRSESEWPSFRSSKADPLFVMRMVLGLFLSDELAGEEELARLMQKQEELEKRLPVLKQEPRFRVNLYESELRSRLRRLLPLTPDIETMPFRSGDLFLPDLEKLTEQVAQRVTGRIGEAQDARAEVVRKIDSISGRINMLERQHRQMEVLFNIQSSAEIELDGEVAQRQQEREQFEKASDRTCLLGRVLYRECPIVQDRQQIIQISQAQDEKAIQEMVARQREEIEAVNGQLADLRREISELRRERVPLQQQRERLDAEIQDERDGLRDLSAAHGRLAEWSEKVFKSGDFKELDECRKTLNDTMKQIEKMQVTLNDLIAKHDQSRNLISSIFSAAVRGIISTGAYDGAVTLTDRELNFRITHGTAMSGEAVETLAVLLADLTCLVYNSVSGRSRLPGFLLHDSPREADLSLRLYRRFLSLAASLQEHFDTPDNCPFQYVITTTTPPPEALRNNAWVKLHLNAAVPAESLFRCNIAIADGNELEMPKNPDDES